MSSKVRLVIVHQNRLFRESLTSALGGGDDMEVVGLVPLEADEAWPEGELMPDLLLLDACLPDRRAFRLVHALGEQRNGPRIILMVPSSFPEMIESCLQAGANGCVLDDDTLDDLRQAIVIVLSGMSYCSPQMAYRLFSHTQPGQNAPWPSHQASRTLEHQLTQREVEILRLIANRNMSNKQIARELRLSVYTVKNHVHNIIEKLGVDDRLTAARHAVRQGLLSELIC